MTDRLATALRTFHRAEASMKRARHGLHEAIRAEVAGGASKSSVGRSVGYTREYIAKICDDAA